jgi:hypothetical protein
MEKNSLKFKLFEVRKNNHHTTPGRAKKFKKIAIKPLSQP